MARKNRRFRNELDFIYQSFAGKFNERMQQLEKYGHTRYAYRKAAKELKYMGLENKRLPSIFSGSRNIFRRLLNIARKFLSSISSSRRGVKSVYRNIINKLKDKYPGVDFNEDNLADIFEGDLMEDLKTMGWGYNTVITALGKIKMNEDEIKDIMKRSDGHVSTNFDESDAVNQFIDDLVNGKLMRNKDSKRSLSLNKLYKGFGQ